MARRVLSVFLAAAFFTGAVGCDGEKKPTSEAPAGGGPKKSGSGGPAAPPAPPPPPPG
jgi:hypothetical protein